MKQTFWVFISVFIFGAGISIADIHKCDRLASYGRDHQTVSEAIEVDILVRHLPDAILACQNAFNTYPENLRFKFQLARAYLADDNAEHGLPLMLKTAELGYPAAQYQMGLIYREGRLLPQDNAIAREWYDRAVAAGNAHAMYNLGVMKRRGIGGEADLTGAVNLYQHAADLGHADAWANLGMMHLKGLGADQNDRMAFEATLKAAERSSLIGMYNAGYFYEEGIGTRADRAKAIEWYRRAADLGDHEAQAALESLLR
ncbi:tetratricopeptide repeat protein [Parasulfitobacter algicola]|uniref:Sel1 repeat family protein n=1 Tax=Parasulfitobacter algicola TaxID=2614809 RepID=A0ABX2IQX7_9RHOB|nr:tetratricopeptide repeat protein [Sulfitobacter algicola]NSX55277.1 sel1 repeat family protein [Sulfitobacter algicola]